MYKLLIADDEEIILEGIKESIDWKAYNINEIFTANDGIEALDIAVKSKPDIIITDIKMPGLSGLEMISKIKEVLPFSKFIVISAYEDFSYAKESIQLGVQTYLTKPLKKQDIIDEVCRAEKEIYNEQSQNDNRNKFEKSYISNLPIIRGHYLNNLIKGVTEFTSDYKHELKECNIGVIVCKGDNTMSTAYELFEKENELVYLNLIERLTNSFNNIYNYNIFQSYNNELVVIYNATDPSDQCISDIIKRIEDVKKHIMLNFNTSLSFGIGRIYAKLSDTKFSYQEAVKSLNYRLVYGNNTVLYINNMENVAYHPNYVFSSFNSIFDSLENILSMGKVSEVFRLIDKINLKIQCIKTMPYYYIQLIYSQLLSVVLRTILELNISIDILPDASKDFYGELFKNQTIEEMNKWFNDLIIKSCNAINENKSPKINNLISISMKYICNNLSKDIGLVEVAEYVELNPSYFSRLFKEETGSSFVEYIKALKIEKAKELLRHGNKKIYEVCDELGYQSIQYFSTLFKSEVGMTPIEYKKVGK